MTLPALSILIPAYNEEGALADTVAAIQRAPIPVEHVEIIVINDGSSDRTAEIARTLPVTLLEHDVNLGYGAALKNGIEHARHPHILITDADGTYPLEDIPRLLEHAATHDMVVGARTGADVHIPLLRRPAKWFITRLAEYLSGRKIPDLNSGMRVFRKEVAQRFLPLYPDGFSFTTTITLAMLTNRYRVKFIPINYRKRVGKSSIHPIRDTVNFTILIVRMCASFKPLNVFLPPALLLIAAGIVKGAIDYTGALDPRAAGRLGLLSVGLFMTGVQMVFIALLADLIDRRMKL
jgi:glycosyltransferase involved in cell wall biosynthesis